ncbi:MAG: MarR family transcriptional regulator [Solirubrobacteraceae bacterium]
MDWWIGYTCGVSDNGSTPPAALMERLSFLLKQAFALMDEATERELTQLNVNGREFAVLTLVDAEGAASQQRLAARIGVDRTTMVALIDALEEKRLVSRRRDPRDRRAYIVEATPTGRKTLQRALKAVKLAEQQALAPLTAAESAAFKQALQRLAQAPPTQEAKRPDRN